MSARLPAGVGFGLLFAVLLTGSAADPTDKDKDKEKDPMAGYETVLRDAGVKTDPEGLLNFFRSRTLSDAAQSPS